ncbi:MULTISPECIES: ArsR/SmtB family transcription factor [Micrococcales]|jgi:DNA-binding transcriptional ArsR family regulator|uniref:DNA-binding transcriptional ArsR family regulator n=1 Tax=Arthrobacter russicus TaxID=172040 RepID=A0ABU1J7P2_9MICC|nr:MULTISPECIES: metalloregulator ArsR/SmtB family transcription factor [Micrococcales]MDR6268443.1 DNA-binding transcriptional ArsR family regulator [Arthrobacter russicus]
MVQMTAESEDRAIAGAVDVFRTLAEGTRIRIILALAQHPESSVGQLASRVGRPAPAVSQHLNRLQRSGMVRRRRDGQRMLYHLVDEHAADLANTALHYAAVHLEDRPTHHAQTR